MRENMRGLRENLKHKIPTLERKLYWGDARLDKIELVYLDNMVRIVLKKAAPQHPFDLAVYDRHLFYTDWVLHAVVRVNKITGKLIVLNYYTPFKIRRS
jgi:hypothetical protein